MMGKNFILHSLSILYDKLSLYSDKALVKEINKYLMIAVYKMFRMVYSANPKNAESMFRVPKTISEGYSNGAMLQIEANVKAILAGEPPFAKSNANDSGVFAMTTESISKEYPRSSSGLLNLIKICEDEILK